MTDTQDARTPTAEQLQALGKLTLEVFNHDRKWWSMDFPTAIIAAIQSIQGDTSDSW